MTFIGSSFGQVAPNTGGGGGGGGDPVQYTASTQKSTFGRRDSNVTIPAGALFVEVVNLEIQGVVTVNGKDYQAGERFHSEVFVNEVDRTVEFVEEVVIQSSGVEFLFRVSYPGASPVNPNTI